MHLNLYFMIQQFMFAPSMTEAMF